MAETQTTATPKAPKAKLTGAELLKARAARRKARRAGNKKRDVKLHADKEFAKTYFEARSKRSTDKKSAFRKKKSRKK
jgi:hypothetical protein